MSLSDTEPSVRRRYVELLRTQSVAQRWQKIGALNRGMKRLLAAKLRSEFPSASEEEIRQRITVRLYGREIAERIHGLAPGDAR